MLSGNRYPAFRVRRLAFIGPSQDADGLYFPGWTAARTNAMAESGRAPFPNQGNINPAIRCRLSAIGDWAPGFLNHWHLESITPRSVKNHRRGKNPHSIRSVNLPGNRAA